MTDVMTAFLYSLAGVLIILALAGSADLRIKEFSVSPLPRPARVLAFIFGHCVFCRGTVWCAEFAHRARGGIRNRHLRRLL